MMIPRESFLRRVPTVLDLKQRLVFEGAACAINSIAWSYDRLREAAAQIADQPHEAFTAADEYGIFVNCWSIVDQCHMLRTLLRNLPLKQGGKTEAFIGKYESVTLLRNEMDHFPQLLNNLATQKESRPPVFGMLSFALVSDADIETKVDGTKELKGCRVVTLTAGSLIHRDHQFKFPNPAGKPIELPIGMFEFEGPNHSVSFSEMIGDLRVLVAHFDTSVAKTIEERVREAAKKNGLDAEKLLAEHSGGMKFELHYSFDDEERAKSDKRA